MTTEPASRAARAAIFAAVCVVTAALGHAWSSGSSPPWFVLGSAFTGTVSAAWWIAGRERGPLVVTGSTVVAQFGLHSLFDLLRPSPTASMAGMEHVELMKRMNHEQLTEHMASTGMKPMDMSSMDMMAPGVHSSTLMIAAHTLAALVCGLWLWRGESAAFRLGRSLAAAMFVPLRLALRITGSAPPPQLPEAPVIADPASRLHAALLQHVVSRRGPPGYVACC
ncbi:hypothetical protein ACWD0J_17820 [Streptomyces sp. NPDC003011]